MEIVSKPTGSWWTTPSPTASNLVAILLAVGTAASLALMWVHTLRAGVVLPPLLLLLQVFLTAVLGAAALTLAIVLTSSPMTPLALATIMAISGGFSFGVSAGTMHWVGNLVEKQAAIDDFTRSQSIRAFVGYDDSRMSVQERASLIAELTAMPDETLCKMAVLPQGRCPTLELPPR